MSTCQLNVHIFRFSDCSYAYLDQHKRRRDYLLLFFKQVHHIVFSSCNYSVNILGVFDVTLSTLIEPVHLNLFILKISYEKCKIIRILKFSFYRYSLLLHKYINEMRNLVRIYLYAIDKNNTDKHWSQVDVCVFYRFPCQTSNDTYAMLCLLNFR